MNTSPLQATLENMRRQRMVMLGNDVPKYFEDLQRKKDLMSLEIAITHFDDHVCLTQRLLCNCGFTTFELKGMIAKDARACLKDQLASVTSELREMYNKHEGLEELTRKISMGEIQRTAAKFA